MRYPPDRAGTIRRAPVALLASLLAAGLWLAGCGRSRPSAQPVAVVAAEVRPKGAEDETLARGPNGEPAVRASQVVLETADIEKVKALQARAVMLWAGSGEWYNAITAGAQAEFARLGVRVVSKADAQFDAARQATDVETSLALKPDIMLALLVDPVSAARAFQPAVDAGVTLVFADNGADGYQAGKQCSAIVTGDQFGMGREAARLLSEALGGRAPIGYIYHDAQFFVTNNRDREFKRTVLSRYPGMRIVAEAGFSQENKTEEVAAAMLIQHPEVKGIYVAWDVAAEGVVAALRAAGRYDVKVVTHDLGATNDLDMVMDGNVCAKVADRPFEIGETMARAAALKLIGKPVPPFIVTPSFAMDKRTVVEGWQQTLHKAPPAILTKALARQRS